MMRGLVIGCALLIVCAFACRTSVLAQDGDCSATALVVTPRTTFPVQPNETALYEVTVSNRAPRGCPAQLHLFVRDRVPADFSQFATPALLVVEPQEQAIFYVALTGRRQAAVGVRSIPFTLQEALSSTRHTTDLRYEVAPAGACSVDPERELLIRDLSVVEDPVRTRFDPGADDPLVGAWSFGRLMERAADTPNEAPNYVERLFETWLADQRINGQLVAARSAVSEVVLGPWPRRGDGSLDLTRAPVRLLAIVNRVDLRRLSRGHAGELRFVFGVVDPVGAPLPFTLILEYRMPADSRAEALAWARSWHELSVALLPSEQYNRSLQALTDRLITRASLAAESPLRSLRSNELSLGAQWEMRQFHPAHRRALLRESPVELTPALSWLDSPALAAFINQHSERILRGQHRVPRMLNGAPFLAPSAAGVLLAWTAPGVSSNQARHMFSLATCNGCHGDAETRTEFVHVAPRERDAIAELSGFLLGIAVPDPVSGELRVFSELHRRKQVLERMVCPCSPKAECERPLENAQPDHEEPEVVD